MREPAHRDAVDFLMHASEHQDAQALEQAFARVLEGFNVTAFSCSKQDSRRPRGPPVVMAQRATAAWDQYMADQGYFAINPCVKWTASGRTTFTWREVQAENRRIGRVSAKERALWADAADNDMRDGLVVRTMAPTGQLLSIRMLTAEQHIRTADKSLLETLAIVFSALRHRFHEQEIDVPLNATLTRREAECLRWAAQGLHDYEIAERLGISANTVRNHMQNAMRKLGSSSRLAAYYRALSLGALD
ncbi:MAG TPA: LuxR C-terminal-related transcriptional regulator [Caulobacteraceae bacterium]